MMPAGTDSISKEGQMKLMGQVQNVVIPEGSWDHDDTTEDLHKNKKNAITLAARFVCHGFRARLWLTLVAATVLFAGVLPTWAQESSNIVKTESSNAAQPAQESSDIAKAAQNPIAHMISVPLENDFYPHTGSSKDDEYVLEMKPVIPIPLSQDWNLITRTIVPIIQTPDLSPTLEGTSGLGDIQESLFFSPTKGGPGGIIWGAGPVITAPTATEKIYGTGKTSIGPTLVVLKIQGHWLFGSLAQNLWSVEAGPRDRPAVNQMLVQPFVNYNLPHKWYLTSSPIITANWKVDSGRWLVPVGGGVGKIVHFGKTPVNIYTQVFRNVDCPNGTSKWSARLQMQFLFPRK
jgi:hypothetical protein